jgi:hypothetical protein
MRQTELSAADKMVGAMRKQTLMSAERQTPTKKSATPAAIPTPQSQPRNPDFTLDIACRRGAGAGIDRHSIFLFRPG